MWRGKDLREERGSETVEVLTREDSCKSRAQVYRSGGSGSVFLLLLALFRDFDARRISAAIRSWLFRAGLDHSDDISI